MTVAESRTGVEVHATFFPLSFFLFLCTPRIDIDGKVQKKPWGRHFFSLNPGRHTVRVYFPYFFMSQCGANSIDVTVAPGRISQVEYFMPPWMMAKGSISLQT